MSIFLWIISVIAWTGCCTACYYWGKSRAFLEAAKIIDEEISNARS